MEFELAVNNINQLVDKLDVDLFTEVIDWEEMRNFQLAMFKKWSSAPIFHKTWLSSVSSTNLLANTGLNIF